VRALDMVLRAAETRGGPAWFHEEEVASHMKHSRPLTPHNTVV